MFFLRNSHILVHASIKFNLLRTRGFQPHSPWSKFQNTSTVSDPISHKGPTLISLAYMLVRSDWYTTNPWMESWNMDRISAFLWVWVGLGLWHKFGTET